MAKGMLYSTEFETVGRGIRISALPVCAALEETDCYIHTFNSNNLIFSLKLNSYCIQYFEV